MFFYLHGRYEMKKIVGYYRDTHTGELIPETRGDQIFITISFIFLIILFTMPIWIWFIPT